MELPRIEVIMMREKASVHRWSDSPSSDPLNHMYIIQLNEQIAKSISIEKKFSCFFELFPHFSFFFYFNSASFKFKTIYIIYLFCQQLSMYSIA